MSRLYQRCSSLQVQCKSCMLHMMLPCMTALLLRKPPHLQATNPVYEEAEAVAQRPAAVEDFSAVVENDAFVPTSPVQEAAGRASPDLCTAMAGAAISCCNPLQTLVRSSSSFGRMSY